MDQFLNTALNPQYILPLLGALLAGGCIGFERGFRGQPAGFRTHSLLALTSALLMVAANHQMAWIGPNTPQDVIRIDPVRMAHGILTGVGFLGGGVIFRSGFNVHGLTTAASVWTTSCIGILFGIGFWQVAISGTVLALMVLAGFRLIDQRLPQQSLADITIRYARGSAPGAEELRERLKALGLKSAPLSERLLKKGQYIEHGATISALNRQAIDRLAAELRADHKVIEFEIEPRNA
ncbi:MAG: MgtC/SapB family protein [Caulobacterales bacterium]|nr:MgtC/SapB family protein [Caulobacterales bacterium]